MNAHQQKALLKAARAQLAILEADPVMSRLDTTYEFQMAIEYAAFDARYSDAPVKVTAKRKPGKLKNRPFYGWYQPWRNGKCLDAADASAFSQSVQAYFNRTCKPSNAPLSTLQTESIDPRKTEREAIKARLEYCACQHKADRHKLDKDDNLLACADCDCHQFHYEIDQQAA